MSETGEIVGRLILDDEVAVGRVAIEDGVIAAVELRPDADRTDSEVPYITPGFVDVHVHGWGGHSAMGPTEDLDGMAAALLRHGVTSFLPTAWSTPLPELHAFADRVRAWIPRATASGAQPLGFNLEGPFISAAKKGAHNPALLRPLARPHRFHGTDPAASPAVPSGVSVA